MPKRSAPPAHALAGAAATVAHWARGEGEPAGFYVPYRYAARGGARPCPAWLVAQLEASAAAMGPLLDTARELAPALTPFAAARADDAHGPRFDQDWFTGLDATLAYAMVHRLRPRRVVEVGSGHSTRFLARAIADSGARSVLESIDPAPRREIDVLCDRVHRVPVTACDAATLTSLGSGDVLFVDGSHVLMAGTDVDALFCDVLPGLAAGVILHVHDIFLPDPYPPQWAWRGYNEQLLVTALLGGGRLEILAANAFTRRYRSHLLEGVYAPCPTGAFESSLWLRTR